MAQDYVNDIFISYTHDGPANDWVKKLFFPALKEWLPEYTPPNYSVKIFIDTEIETGEEWPPRLRHALKMSRCLLPILCPGYFRSKWCQAELQSMQEREKIRGLRTEENPSGLIYPVVFASPEYLRTEIQNIQWKDMCQWATTYPNFRYCKYYESFEIEIKNICKELWQMIQRVPDWEDWPVVIPLEPQGTPPPVAVSLPRL